MGVVGALEDDEQVVRGFRDGAVAVDGVAAVYALAGWVGTVIRTGTPEVYEDLFNRELLN